MCFDLGFFGGWFWLVLFVCFKSECIHAVVVFNLQMYSMCINYAIFSLILHSGLELIQ